MATKKATVPAKAKKAPAAKKSTPAKKSDAVKKVKTAAVKKTAAKKTVKTKTAAKKVAVKSSPAKVSAVKKALKKPVEIEHEPEIVLTKPAKRVSKPLSTGQHKKAKAKKKLSEVDGLIRSEEHTSELQSH